MKKESITSSIQEFLGFDASEAESFMDNERNRVVLGKIGSLINTRFVFRVIEAKGCGCRHRIGQEICIRGDGVIISDKNADGTCVFLVQAMVPVVFAAQELIYAGLDPGKLFFRHVGCFDVGLSCGGIGHVAVELNVVNAA